MSVPSFELVLEIIAGGGALGAIIAFLFEKLEWFQSWPSEVKKWFIIGFCLLAPLGAWAIQLALGYVVAPVGAQGWTEAIWHELAIGFVAWGGSQATHILFNKRLNGS